MQPSLIIKPRRGRMPGTVYDRLKCKRCRKDKQKCHPGKLPFPQQPCQRCEEKNLDCSEREQAQTGTSASLRSVTREGKKIDMTMMRSLESIITKVEIDPSSTRPFNSYWNDHLRVTGSSLHRETAERIDLLMSVERLISTTSENLRGYAQNLAKVYSHFYTSERFFEERIIVSFDRLRHFLAFIQESLRFSTIQGCMLDKPDEDVMYWCPVSRVLSEETLRAARTQITEYQRMGRCGTAYFLKYHHLRNHKDQFTKEDRDQLEELAKDFTQMLRRISRQALDQRVPQPFWSTFLEAPLLPHEYLLIKYTKENKHRSNISLRWEEPLPNERRSDCLGRSISHVLYDYGYRATWRDVDTNHSDFLGRTAIYQACCAKELSVVERLLHNGADPHKPTVIGVTPLHVAASRGFHNACERIYEADKGRIHPYHVQSLTDCMSRTPVMCAARGGHLRTVELFCKDILSPHELHQLGSALRDAVREGHLHIVQFLLKYGQHFDVREKGLDGHDAMSLAREYGYEMIKEELSALVNLNDSAEENSEPTQMRGPSSGHVFFDNHQRVVFLESLREHRARKNLGFKY